jgi:hypothetical protein
VTGILLVLVGTYLAFSSSDVVGCAPNEGGCITAINDYFYIDWGIATLIVGIAVLFITFLGRVPGIGSSKKL